MTFLVNEQNASAMYIDINAIACTYWLKYLSAGWVFLLKTRIGIRTCQVQSKNITFSDLGDLWLASFCQSRTAYIQQDELGRDWVRHSWDTGISGRKEFWEIAEKWHKTDSGIPMGIIQHNSSCKELFTLKRINRCLWSTKICYRDKWWCILSSLSTMTEWTLLNQINFLDESGINYYCIGHSDLEIKRRYDKWIGIGKSPSHAANDQTWEIMGREFINRGRCNQKRRRNNEIKPSHFIICMWKAILNFPCKGYWNQERNCP